MLRLVSLLLYCFLLSQCFLSSHAWTATTTIRTTTPIAHRCNTLTKKPSDAPATATATATIQRTRTRTSLFAIRNRGLEVRTESATPTEGGMTLYCKAGPDGTASIGDCPFCQSVRMVLEEKKLDYELKPTTADSKPAWLIEHYGGKMPALRHRKECYVESDIIMAYLQFFFQSTNDLLKGEEEAGVSEDAAGSFFPTVAKYLKHTPDGDEDDEQLRQYVCAALENLENQVKGKKYWCGDAFSLQDCRLAPKLYILEQGLKLFKSNSIDIAKKFPAVRAYMDALFARPSFQATVYPVSVLEWGWSNARKK